MKYTSHNIECLPNANRYIICLPVRNIFASILSLFLLSFFGGVQAQTITINSITPNPPVCAGSSITINFTSNGLNGNNNYTGTLSQSNGTFIPSALATSNTVNFTNNGTSNVTLTIPATATTSSSYVVRVTSGGTIGTSAAFTINALPTITLTSGNNVQTRCINNAINNITYTLGGSATNATVSGLPSGVSGSFSGGVYTLSGTPTQSGTFNYTITTTSPCTNVTATGTLTVTPDGTITLSSATASPTTCINTAVSNITYAIGGSATGATVAGLPAGITGSYSGGVFTISGTPSVSGSFPYTVTTTGSPCVNPTLGGTINVTANGTISLTSATASPTTCVNAAVSNITYNIGGTATGATALGLPTGVTGSYSGGIFTISGVPTVSGSFPYTVTTTGSPCVNPSLGGTITVNANSTISLSSAVGTDAQTKCISTALTPITYSIGGGGTGASITAGTLPAGVSGNFSGGVFTISGTPTASGTFNYTVTTSGPCNNVSASGTITIDANSTINLSSGAGTNIQTVCINNPITDITYSIGGGGTGASITAGTLPAGISANFSGGVFTISGTPTASGTFNYTVTTSGPCSNVSATGTITVNANSTISLSSGVGTDAQTKCINTALTPISYNIGGGGTGASITAGALPTGVTGSFAGGVFTISGTPSTSGVFNYTVTTSGPCTNISASGSITVTTPPAITTQPVSQTVCNGSSATFTVVVSGTSPITYQWRKSGVDLIGATSSSYTTNTTGSYDVVIANSCGTVTSNSVTLSNYSALNAGSFTTTAVTACSNYNPAGFNLNSPAPSGGSGVYTYQWQLNGSDIAGATSSTYNSPNLVTPGTYVFNAVVSDGCTSASTPTKTITIVADPSVIISGGGDICKNESLTLSSAISDGTGSYTYQWQSGTSSTGPWSNIAGATSSTFSPSTSGTGTFYYQLNIFPNVGSCNNATSNVISVTVNELPTATITGTPSFCSGFNTVLSAASSSAGSGSITGYQWNLAGNPIGGATSSTYTVTAAGSYTVTITNSNNCSTTSAPTNVTVNAIPTITGTLSVCINSTTTLSGSGTPASTNPWESSNSSIATVSNMGVVTGISAGTADITYTDNNGCQRTVTVTVNVLPTISGNLSICKPTQLTGSGTPNAINPWISSNTAVATITSTGIATGVSAGTTNITYTDNNGCQATVTLTVDPLPLISGTLAVCAGATSQLTASVPPAATNPWVSSNTSIATVNATGLVTAGTTAGTTNITYTDENGCQKIETFTVIKPVVSAPATVCVGSTITLSPTTGGTWTSSNNAVATVTNAGVVTGVSAGTVTFTFTDGSGCSNTTSSVTVNALPVVSAPATVCVGSTITLSPTTGGTWTSSNNAVATVTNAGVVTGISAGNVTFTFTETSTGCSNTTSSVTVNALPVVSAPAMVCIGSTITLSPTTGGTWTSSNNAVATVTNAGVVTGVTAGSVTFTFTETATGCSNTTPSVTVNALPVVTAPAAVCIGSTITLSPTTGGTWTSSSNAVATVTNAGVVTGVSAGNVTFTFTHTATGCSNTTSSVTVNALPVVSAPATVCVGSTITLSPITGGTWASSNNAVATVTNAGVVTGVSAGNVTFTFTETATGCSNTTSSVTVNALPVVSAPAMVCIGSTITLSPTTGGTWVSSNNAVATVTNAGVVTGVSAGSVTFTFTHTATGCSNTTSSVTVNSLPVVSAPAAVCIGSTITLSPTTGGTWASSNNAVATVTNAGVVTGVSAGNATFTFTHTATGCSNTTTSVTVNALPVVSAPATVCVGNTITLSPTTGGTWTSSNDAIATVTNGGVATGVSAGNVTFTFTDANNCSNTTSSVTVKANATVTLTSAAGTDNQNVCIVNSTPAFTTITYSIGNTINPHVTVTGLPPGVTSNYNSGVLTISGGPTTAGTYTYTITTITNSTFCPIVKTGVIKVNPVVDPNSYNFTQVYACNTPLGVILQMTGTPTGGDGTFIYQWYYKNNCGNAGSFTPVAAPEGNQPNLTPTVAGCYWLQVNSGGCQAFIDPQGQTNRQPINGGQADINIAGNDSLCVGSTTTLTASSNVTGYTYTWSPATYLNTTSGATVTFSGAPVGSYTYTVTGNDGAGCSKTSTVTVVVNPLPTASISGNAGVCQNAASPNITFTGAGGTAPYTFTYNINGGSNTTVTTTSGNSVTVAVPTNTVGSFIYTLVTVRDNNSCQPTAPLNSSVTVTVNAPPVATITGNAAFCAGGNTVLSAATSTPGSGTIASYQWNLNGAPIGGATGQTYTATAAGNYTVTVTNSNGCSTTSAATSVTVNPLPTITGTLIVCVGATTQLTGSPTAGANPWTSSNTSVATISSAGLVTGVAAGTTTITYTDSNGCQQTATITVNPKPAPIITHN